jgi:hypothetical protein
MPHPMEKDIPVTTTKIHIGMRVRMIMMRSAIL